MRGAQCCDSDEVLARCLCLYACDGDVLAVPGAMFSSLKSTLITCHAIFLVGMLGLFRYTEPSDENECNFNEINSTNSE